MEQIERQVAYKIWLSNLNNGEYTKQEGEFAPNYINVDGKKISRINTVATVIQKTTSDDETYSSLTIDDGSAQIRVKAWKEDVKIFSEVDVSDLILLIGKLREYQDELYITPEVVKKVSPKFQILRNLELNKEYGKPKPLSMELNTKEETIEVKEEKIGNSPEQNRQVLLDKIQEFDQGEGAEISKVLTNSGIEEKEAEKMLQSLLLEGEVFNISSDKVKLT